MDAVKKFLLDLERYRTEGAIFPPEFDWPGPYHYHGTSSSRCEMIQQEGLLPAMSGISLADCEAVAVLFEMVNWLGHQQGGGPSLRSFSLRHDLALQRGDPIFVSVAPDNASYFASRHYAGGEKASAIRKSLDDLHRFVDDAVFREQQSKDAERRLDEVGPVRISRDDIAALRDGLRHLSGLRERCMAPYVKFGQGVVYAVRLESDFIAKYAERINVGLRIFAPVPASAIVAKVYLPIGFKPGP